MQDTILLRNARKLIEEAYVGDNRINGNDNFVTDIDIEGRCNNRVDGTRLQGGVLEGSERFARLLPEVR